MKRLALALFLVTCSATHSWAASLTLSVHDGLVSLDAQDVTLRQILTEWARVGRTRIINVERIAGGPITLKLDAVPEKQALDIILRTIPGYMAVPRATQVADASLYDSILIMATTTAVAAPRPQQPGPVFPGQGVTQLRPTQPAPLSPGMLIDPPNSADQMDDPALAAAAAAGLVPVPALQPAPGAISSPLTLPGQPRPAQPAPGAGAPTNPWNAPIGTPQPSLAPPAPVEPTPPPAGQRVRPPQADR